MLPEDPTLRERFVADSLRDPEVAARCRVVILSSGGTMNWDDEEDTTIYKVVLNHEEQYSIWPEDRENPPGWRDAGKSGPRDECLAYIETVWTDMRPLSLRRAMDGTGDEARG